MLQLRRSKCLQLLSLLALLATQSYAVNFLAGVPSCATNCAVINDANGACVTDYDPTACFCGRIAGLNTQDTVAADSVCADSGCSTPQDGKQLYNYYQSKCADPATMTSSSSTTPVPTMPPSRPKPQTPTTTRTSTYTTPSAEFTGTLPSGDGQDADWWPEHGKWIIMVIVLIIGFGIIIAVGIIFKRRYDQKQSNISPLESSGLWGGNSNQYRNSQISHDGYANSHIDDEPSMKQRGFH